MKAHPRSLCRVLFLSLLALVTLRAQQYRNPVLFADYSDPDVIRDGKDFYLVASTFHFVPGIPILHSRDLVHWELSGHVVPRLTMNPAYDLTGPARYAGGIWAPSVRFHDGLFYVYFPTPDEGIFVSTAPRMTGPWSAPETVLAGPGYEDPCPFWDDNGDAWLVHSRKGAGPLILHRMSVDGKHLLDAGKTIVDDPVHLKTLEGPKVYKRDGWYYIFAPMGGVGTGSQAVLRSRSIQGPYESRIVLAQGSTSVNGPHQGGWVEGTDGRSWFVHFQQRGAHGRIVWLEPMRWQPDGWPVMGQRTPGAAPGTAPGTPGEPVATYDSPVQGEVGRNDRMPTSDDFNAQKLGEMWEWNHNPDDTRWSLTERPGYLRLHPGQADGLLHARNTLTECMQDQSLQVTAVLDASHLHADDRAGLSAFDRNLSGIGVAKDTAGTTAIFFTLSGKTLAGPTVTKAQTKSLRLRVRVIGDSASYSYSVDQGRNFLPFGEPVTLVLSWWKGARPALFAFNTTVASKGVADFDSVQYERLP